MLNKKANAKLAFILMILAVMFTACKSIPPIKTGMEFMPWKGEWVSSDVVKDEKVFDMTYKMIAENMSYYTADGLKAATEDMYKTPIIKAKFDGTNTVIFTIKNKEGKEIEKACEYKYLGQKEDGEYKGLFWETFEAVTEDRALADVKYFIALRPEKHGDDGLQHWHTRFGRRGIENLLGKASYWPTYYPASTPREELLKAFEGSIKAMPNYTPKEPFASYAAHGKWMNSPLVYENTSKEVEAVYAKLIKEYAGKNPKGGDFTKEEIISLMQKGNETLNDFTHLEFVTKDGKNELIVYKNDKEIFRSNYVRIATNKEKPYMTMMAEKKDAGKFGLISFVVVHGAPNYHFHLWYGANDKELEALKGTPTCFKVDIPNGIRAESIEKSCRDRLNSVIEGK